MNRLYKNFYFKNLLVLPLTLIFLFIMFYYGLINKYFVSGAEVIFSDWNYFLRGLECKYKNIDIFNKNECFTFHYGYPIFFIFYNPDLKYFYQFLIPIIFISLFVIIIFKIIYAPKFFNFILFILAIFNPSTLLLIERFNIDLLIFLLIIFLAYNKNFVIDLIIFFLSFLLKYYPIIFIIKIFLKKHVVKKKNINFFLFLVIFFTLSLIFYIYFLKFFTEINSMKAGYHYLFSINALPKFFKYIFQFNYQFLLIINYLIMLFLINFLLKSNFFNNILSRTYETDNFNKNLFILSSNTLIFSYFFFSNYYYREVYLIGTLPFILDQAKKNYFKKNFYFVIMVLIIIRYIFLFFYGYFSIGETFYYFDNTRKFTNIFLYFYIFKAFLDQTLITLLIIPVIKTNFYILKNNLIAVNK
jgi:hypothetical protein